MWKLSGLASDLPLKWWIPLLKEKRGVADGPPLSWLGRGQGREKYPESSPVFASGDDWTWRSPLRKNHCCSERQRSPDYFLSVCIQARLMMAFEKDTGEETVVDLRPAAEPVSPASQKGAFPSQEKCGGSSEEGIPRVSEEGNRVKEEVLDEREPDTSDDEEDGGEETASQGIATRVLSRLTSRSSVDPGPPPDGGWLAWSQCMLKCPFHSACSLLPAHFPRKRPS